MNIKNGKIVFRKIKERYGCPYGVTGYLPNTIISNIKVTLVQSYDNKNNWYGISVFSIGKSTG